VDLLLHEWHHLKHGRFFILVYIDDLMVAGQSFSGVEAIKIGFSAKFDVRDMGEVKDVFGMKVIREKRAGKRTLSNPGHVMALLQEFGLDTCTLDRTAMASSVELSKSGENIITDGNRYAELVGSLLFFSTRTRPDIFLAVDVLWRFR